jgi:hypothetical protein
MNKFSMTYAGILAAALGYIFSNFDIKLPYTNEQIESALTTVITILGFVIALLGRYRAGGLKWTGFRVPTSLFKTLKPNEVVKFDDETR